MHLETQFIKFSPAEVGVGQAVQAARSPHISSWNHLLSFSESSQTEISRACCQYNNTVVILRVRQSLGYLQKTSH